MTLLTTVLGRTLRITGHVSPALAGALAFRLFRYPGPRAGVRRSEQVTVDQAESDMLPLAGQSLATYRWGAGTKPVLMSHGWSARGSRYAPLVPGLVAWGYRPITFDAPVLRDSPARRLPMPMLVVHDQEDSVVSVSQAHQIAAAHGPKVRLLITRGLGHHRILSAPDVVEQIVEFVAGARNDPDPSGTDHSALRTADG